MEKNSERRRFVKQYQESVFGEWQNQEVRAYRLENDKGYQLSVMTYGATILEYVTPDKEDQFANIILGFDRFEDYVGNSCLLYTSYVSWRNQFRLYEWVLSSGNARFATGHFLRLWGFAQ